MLSGESLRCQIAKLTPGVSCPSDATAVIGAVRLCDAHLKLVRAIAKDAGVSRAEVDAEIGKPGVRAKKHQRITRRCENAECGATYESSTHHKASTLCPKCRVQHSREKANEARREWRPETARCICGKTFEVNRLGRPATECPECRQLRERRKHPARCRAYRERKRKERAA